MTDDTEFQKRLVNQLSLVIDGMKSLNERISGNLDTVGRFETEFVKITRQNNQIRSDILDIKSDLGQFRSETNQRLQALFHRVDEIETIVDGNAKGIKELQIENRSHYNDILTALQDGLHNSISVREISERVDELERRPGR